jgi:hypothetical protein
MANACQNRSPWPQENKIKPDASRVPADPAVCTMLFLGCRRFRVGRGYTMETTANGMAQANVVSAKGTDCRMAAAESVASKVDETFTHLANRDAGRCG